jgi:hypothetical protein
MCIETMQLSDIAHRKVRVSPHVVDELRDMSLDDRQAAMYDMLKSITPKLHLTNYYPLTTTYTTGQAGALVIDTTKKAVSNYCVVMYPWTAKGNDIIWTHRRIGDFIKDSQSTRLKPQIRTRLEESTLVHISYKNIYTKAIEIGYLTRLDYYQEFANAWNEPWGRIIKWEANILELHEKIVHGKKQFQTSYHKEARYEFFVPNVTSKAELQDRLEKLLAWVYSNIT